MHRATAKTMQARPIDWRWISCNFSFRILAWSIFFYRRQVCDARGICIKCVVYALNYTHAHRLVHTQLNHMHQQKKFSRFNLFSVMVESLVESIFSIFFHVSFRPYWRIYVSLGSTPISITLFIMVQKRSEDEDHDEQRNERKESKKLGMDTCTLILILCLSVPKFGSKMLRMCVIAFGITFSAWNR